MDHLFNYGMCPWRCHEIGGPWIAENPSCPIHGAERREMSDDERFEVEQAERARQHNEVPLGE